LNRSDAGSAIDPQFGAVCGCPRLAKSAEGGIESVNHRAYASRSREVDHETRSDRHRTACDHGYRVRGLRLLLIPHRQVSKKSLALTAGLLFSPRARFSYGPRFCLTIRR